MDKKIVYLAIPYSHPDPDIRKMRFELANKMAAKLLEEEFNVLSPISHSHPISLYMENSNDSDYWTKNSLEFLKFCDELIVYCLPGWEGSKGVAKEIEFAKAKGIPIRYLEG
uniref:DUF1937 domain-containing protein n=1 Tax=viral metagenome TaxID=1070528 RepID=A0A6M3KGZ6_9ZZZZ